MERHQDLHRLSTEERLRQAHIETLETLQRHINENNELRSELQTLQDSFGSTSKHTMEKSRQNSDDFSANERKRELEELRKNLSVARAEAKTLKIQLTNKERQFEKYVEDFRSSMCNMSEKLHLSSEWCSMLTEEQHSNELNRKFPPNLPHTPDINRLSVAKEQDEIPPIVRDLQQRLDASQVLCADLRNQLIAKTDECAALLADRNDTVLKKRDMGMRGGLNQRSEQRENALLKQHRLADQRRSAAMEERVRLLETEARQSREEYVKLRETLSTAANKAETICDNDERGPFSASTQDSTHYFPAFVELKRENRLLKLQVASISEKFHGRRYISTTDGRYNC